MPSRAAGIGVTHNMDWLVLISMRAHFIASKIDGSQLGFLFRVHYTTTVQDHRSFLWWWLVVALLLVKLVKTPAWLNPWVLRPAALLQPGETDSVRSTWVEL